MSTIYDTTNVSVRNQIVTEGKAYPEFARNARGRISTQSVKDWLYQEGFLNVYEYADPKTDVGIIVRALYQAFAQGKLSLNATKQDGTLNLTPVRVSTGLGGKMKGVWAISTISLCNTFCLARMKDPDLVCNQCYVSRSLRIDGILQYTQNMYVLGRGLLPTEWIPVLKPSAVEKHPIVRLESMGDLMNAVQATNYLRIADVNAASGFKFALWTKNPAVLARAIDAHGGKPENLSTVWSMSRVNKMDDHLERWLKYFDHCFVVVRTEEDRQKFLKDRSFYPCQCGPRSCIMCRKCYMRGVSVVTAVELLRIQGKQK